MNISQSMLPVIVLLAPAVVNVLVLGQDKVQASAPTGSFAAVKAEYDAARKRWSEEMRAAWEAKKKSGEVDIAERTGIKPVQFPIPPPDPEFSPRFLAIAEKNPEGPEAIEAIKLALSTSSRNNADGRPLDTRAKAIKLLADHYTTSPKIRDLVKAVAWYDEPEARAFIDDVIARNPDRSLHVAALQRRAQRLATRMRTTRNLKKLDAVRALAGRPQYQDHVAVELAAAEKARVELAEIEKTLAEKYADMAADVRIGSRIGLLVSEDLEGKTVTIESFKGKVVVLDVWFTLCGPCRAMIPNERGLVARLKGKPFALISISVDAKKQTLTDFLAKEPMPWEHWWNGADGKLIDTLNIEHYPTVFVLDTDGVVRYRNVELSKDPNAELEKAVNTLLDEANAKTAL